MSILPTLRGEKILLREINPEIDSIQWYEAMKDPEMHQWTGNTVPANIHDIVKLLTLYKEHVDLIAWSVIDRESEEMIGTYWIAKPILNRNKLIIYDEAQRIAKGFWRRGYTKEARKLIYDFAFNILNVDEIHAHAWSENINSCKSMENISFQLINSYDRRFEKYNRIFKENHYVLLKEDWLRVREYTITKASSKMIKIDKIKIENTKEFWRLRLEGLRTNPEAFGSSYEESVKTPLSEVEKIINDENNYILGAFSENQQLVGIMGFRREQRKKLKHKGTIWGVYVSKEHRRKGIANELLKELLNRTKTLEGLKQINLCVVTSNNAAVELYRKFGFQSYGVEKNALIYHDQGYDEELMAYFFK